MCLDVIRMKLQPRSDGRYTHEAQFVADLRLLFRNVYRCSPVCIADPCVIFNSLPFRNRVECNQVESQLYKDAKKLEEFFDAQLVKLLPEYAFWSGEGEPPAKRARCA